MPTVPYRESLKNIADKNPEFSRELLQDAVDALLSGEVDDGRIMLRDYVNATMGFKELARRTGKIDKNLMRSLSTQGNPTAANLMEIVRTCAHAEGVVLSVRAQTERAPEVRM